jgi:tartrate-resistant acid phosphatase type 5
MCQALGLLLAVVAVCAGSPNAIPSGHRAEGLQRFASLGPADSAFCFVSHGCWGGIHSPSQRAVARLMADVVDSAPSPVRFIIAAGDNFYKRGVKSVTDTRFHDTFESVYTSPALDKLPFIVALGNHDYRGDFLAQVNYTTAQFDRNPATGVQRGTGRWYMPHTYFSIAVAPDMAVVVLDCPLFERCHNNGDASPRCWDGGQQRRWAEQQLLKEHRSRRFKVVVCHYPLHANGPHINFPWLVEWLQPLMEKADVALYINADNHYLQVSHIHPIYYVNSGGGAGIGVRHTPHNKGYSRSPHDVFTDISDGVFLHCVTPSREELVSQAIRSDGKRLFNFTSVKPSAAGDIEWSVLDINRRDTSDASHRNAHTADRAAVGLAVRDPRLRQRRDTSAGKWRGSGDSVHDVLPRRADVDLPAADVSAYFLAASAVMLVLLVGCCAAAGNRNGARTISRRK